jgi:acyl-homoserine lactone acylase PvdQ
MKKISIIVLTAFIFINAVFAQRPSATEKARWAKHAKQTKIIRDEWGIPHIYGKTDADAVFGLMYAQCEENFPQMEKNFLEMLGRQSEMEGQKKVCFSVDINQKCTFVPLIV